MFEVTIPRPIKVRLQDGNVGDLAFEGWLFDILGVDFWKEGNANDMASKLACNERLQDAFDGKVAGDVVRVSDADREWFLTASQRFSFPPHLQGLAAKCMRFLSAVANAKRVDEAS